MTTYVIEVPAWTTLRIEAESAEAALDRLKALPRMPILQVALYTPVGDDVRLSRFATLYPEPARWPNTYDPAAEIFAEEG